MSLLGQFAAPVGAMMAQSKAMEVIGLNIANVNTGGYKRSETNFSTMLANTYDHNMDIGGVRGITRTLVTQQGQMLSSDSNLDLAINGQGFFVLNTSQDGSGTQLYGRDGMFDMALGGETTTQVNGNSVTIREGYLVDKNGYYVQGWPVNADQETFPTDAASLQSLRIDPETFTTNGEATTEAFLGMNVPSNAATGYSESTFIRAYDSEGVQQTYQMRWTNIVLGSHTQTATPDWELPSGRALNSEEVQPITIYNNRGYEKDLNLSWTRTAANQWSLEVREGETALNIGGSTSTTVTFDGSGAIVSPTSLSVSGTADNDNPFTLDLSALTEGAGGAGNSILQNAYTKDGVVAAKQTNKYSLEILHNGELLNLDTDTTPTVMTIEFNENASLKTPTSVTIPASGTGPSFTLDLQKVTNYASNEIVELSYDYNGRSNAPLERVSFNSSGEMIGHFADATTRPIYKLPLATFTNANSLDPINGNVFRLSGTTSAPVIRVAGAHGAGTFSPNTREISNVDMADEFTSMILTQKAYNMGSTTFKTIDEMSQVARDLKR